MANLITLSRLVLLAVVVAIAYLSPPTWQLANVALLIFVFVTDGLDGYVARRRGESSQFGAMFDIAGDRIVELTLWIVLSHLTYYGSNQAMVGLWVPILFVVRGVLVDTVRAVQVSDGDAAPFDMLATGLGRWLVKGKFMRISYAVIKAHAFCWLLLIRGIQGAWPPVWEQWSALLIGVGKILVIASAIVCVLRALPVLLEFLYTQRRALLHPLKGRRD